MTVAFIVTAVVVALVALVGIPIPFTGLVLHSVFAALVAGLVVGGVVYGVCSFVFRCFGVALMRTPTESRDPHNPPSSDTLNEQR